MVVVEGFAKGSKSDSYFTKDNVIMVFFWLCIKDFILSHFVYSFSFQSDEAFLSCCFVLYQTTAQVGCLSVFPLAF